MVNYLQCPVQRDVMFGFELNFDSENQERGRRHSWEKPIQRGSSKPRRHFRTTCTENPTIQGLALGAGSTARLQRLPGSERGFPRSGQSRLRGGVCICWESRSSRGILAVDYGDPSSPCGCLPTGLHSGRQLCRSGKQRHRNPVLIGAKRSSVMNLLSAGVWLILTFTALSTGQESLL